MARARSPRRRRPRRSSWRLLLSSCLLQSAPCACQEAEKPRDRVLVVFSFYDSLHARPNLRFFLRHVVGAPATKHVDVLIVDTTPGGPTVPIPFHPQVRYLHRRNEGFDMCSYKTGLNLHREGDYAYVIFMNGSVRGPFAKGDFVAPFVALFTERVAMVGTTAACFQSPHIQSMLLMLNSAGVRILNRTLTCNITDKWQATAGPGGEVDNSRVVLRQGYGINVLQPIWRNHDFRDSGSTQARCKANFSLYDPYYFMNDVDPVTLRPKDVDPEEVIFFKTNRGITPGKLRALTQAYDDACASGGCGSWNATIPVESSFWGTWTLWRRYDAFSDIRNGAGQLRQLLAETWIAIREGISRCIDGELGSFHLASTES